MVSKGQVAQAVQDRAAVEADVFQQVAGVIGQPAAVGEQVAQGDRSRGQGIGQREVGIVPDDRVIPTDASVSVPHQASHDGGCDGLGDRSQLEDGVGVNGVGRACFADAEALEIDHLVAEDDAVAMPGTPVRAWVSRAIRSNSGGAAVTSSRVTERRGWPWARPACAGPSATSNSTTTAKTMRCIWPGMTRIPC